MAYSEKEKEESFNSILMEIESGQAVRNILRSEDKPSSQTFFKWLEEDEAKSKRYARACELRADAIFEDILAISDDNSKDIITYDLDGIEVEKVDHEHIQRSRLRVDSRKWMAGKLNPKKYSDRMLHGNDPDNPLPPTSIPLVLTNGKTYEDLKNELKPE